MLAQSVLQLWPLLVTLCTFSSIPSYLAATDDKFLEDPPEFIKQTTFQERQIIELTNSFDRNDPAQIAKLFDVLQNGVEEITKKTQAEFKESKD